MTKQDIDKLVEKHGEQYRRLIEDVVPWIIGRQGQWGIEMDVDSCVEELVKHINIRKECKP